MATTKPNRRWYQFRLKTLLVVVMLIAVTVGWIGFRMHRARSDSRNGRCWRGLMPWRHVTYALVVRGVPKPIFVVLAVATVVAVLAVTTTLGGTGFAAIG